MTQVIDEPAAQRLTLELEGGAVWTAYRRDGQVLALTHVEADPQLRGSGAAGRFMQAVVEYARAKGLKLRPICSYAVVWLKRHPEAADVMA
jgi:hypothetical protein